MLVNLKNVISQKDNTTSAQMEIRDKYRKHVEYTLMTFILKYITKKEQGSCEQMRNKSVKD
jgi:hypothetical protein